MSSRRTRITHFSRSPCPSRFVSRAMALIVFLPFLWLKYFGMAGRSATATSLANDCLADKGFSLSRIHLQEGVSVDVYNLHADAGDGQLDTQARKQEFEQLAGDTNLEASSTQDLKTLDTFIQKTGLVDTCQSASYSQPFIDRVLSRHSETLSLEALSSRMTH